MRRYVAMSENILYIERLIDLNGLLGKKSHFLLGPRQTGKTFLIRHTLDGVLVYDLLDSEIFLSLSQNPGRISEELQPQDRISGAGEIETIHMRQYGTAPKKSWQYKISCHTRNSWIFRGTKRIPSLNVS